MNGDRIGSMARGTYAKLLAEDEPEDGVLINHHDLSVETWSWNSCRPWWNPMGPRKGRDLITRVHITFASTSHVNARFRNSILMANQNGNAWSPPVLDAAKSSARELILSYSHQHSMLPHTIIKGR